MAVWLSVAKALPAVSLLAAVGFLWQAVLKRNSADEFKRYFLAALWSALSVMVLAKMFLNPQLQHYGFVLAMPASLLLVCLGVSTLPDGLRSRSGRGELFRAVMLALIVGWGLTYLKISYNSYRGKTLAVGAGGDVTFHNPNANFRNQAIASVMQYLSDRMSEDETLLVMPNGIKINYLLRKRNPTPYLMLTPWEMKVYGGEAVMLETIRQSAPDFIVVIQNDMREHGVNYFGEPGYGGNIMDWIGRNYNLLRTISSTDGAGGSGRIRFVVKIFQHKHTDEKA